MVWKLHLLVKKYLEKYGINVIITREYRDMDKSPPARRNRLIIKCRSYEAINNAYCKIEGN